MSLRPQTSAKQVTENTRAKEEKEKGETSTLLSLFAHLARKRKRNLKRKRQVSQHTNKQAKQISREQWLRVKSFSSSRQAHHSSSLPLSCYKATQETTSFLRRSLSLSLKANQTIVFSVILVSTILFLEPRLPSVASSLVQTRN